MWSGVLLWLWFVFLWSYGFKYNVLNGHLAGRRQWDKVLGLLNPRFLDSLLNIGKTLTSWNFSSLISNSESLLFDTNVSTHWKNFWHDTCPTPGKVSQSHSDLNSSWLWNPKGLVLFSSSLSAFGRLTMLAMLGLGCQAEEGTARHASGLIWQPPGACSASEWNTCRILWRSYENVGWSEASVGTSKSLGRGRYGPFLCDR